MNFYFKACELRRKDFKKAIESAVKGKNFSVCYGKNRITLNLYGKYFLYSEMLKATQIIAAYRGEDLAGALAAIAKGEKRKFRSAVKQLYVKTFEFIQNTFFRQSAGAYDNACRRNAERIRNFRR